MNKKDLKKQYTQTPLTMGVYQIRNLTNGKIFIDSGLNMPGRINSSRFQLSLGSHMNKALQQEYTATGPNNFTFEVLDHLEPKEDPATDYTGDLNMLLEMWIEKLQPFDEKGYNKRTAAT